ncbi:hypothetical protein HPB50_028344 [Hyalomma asiaticum]|nr:hypothetical protein HPB50_028344 [Hyalomma asiaticum]
MRTCFPRRGGSVTAIFLARLSIASTLAVTLKRTASRQFVIQYLTKSVANEVLNRKVAELVAALDKSNKEVMALKIGLPGRPTPTQQLAEERQCERRQQQPPHQQAERAQTPAPATLQTMEDETTTAAAGPAPKRRATESLKEQRINERLNRMEEQHNATINAFNERFANIDSALQQIMAALKKAVLQQHLEQTTVRPDVIVLQETLTEEVKLPGYKASVSPPNLRGTTGSTGREACTLVRKGITFLEHEVLGANSPIEHTFIEVVTGKQSRKESTFILNVYSSPAHRKQKFKALLHKANRIASPSNRLVVCGDFNAPNEAWGYGQRSGPPAGRDQPRADPDNRPGGPHAHRQLAEAASMRTRETGWRNTGHELGSDHYIVEIAVPLSNGGTGINFSNGVRTHRVTDWDAFRGALPVEKVVIEDIEEIMHAAVAECGEDEVRRRLDAKYLPATPAVHHPDYQGATNSSLDRDIEWFPAHMGRDVSARGNANHNETANEAARGFTYRAAQPADSTEEWWCEAKDRMTEYGEVLKWYRLGRRTMPPPHPGLTRSDRGGDRRTGNYRLGRCLGRCS